MDTTLSEALPALPEIYQPENSLGFLLSRLKGRMSAALDEELAELDITHAQWVILMRIASGAGRTSADLCRCSQYDTGSMTRMLDRLEEKGLIVRERSAEDRRVVALSISAHGKELYPQLLAAGKRMLTRMTAGIPEAEVEQTKAVLQRMLGNLDHEEVTP